MSKVSTMVDEGLFIALSAVRMAVKNEIIIGALREHADYDPETYADAARNVRDAATKAGVAVREFKAASPREVDSALGTLTRERADALIIVSDPFLVSQRDKFGVFGLAQRTPIIAPMSDFVREGALMSYGTDYADNFRRSAHFVDRILKGAKPGELPIEQAATFELVVNKKTAAALGIAIPQSVLIRATEVIE